MVGAMMEEESMAKSCSNGAGTVSKSGQGGRRVGIVCDACSAFFPGYRHPVETDLVESPSWVAHVKAAREES